MTAVQPAASAVPTFRVIITDGKLHGVEIKARPIRRRDNTYTTPIKQVVSTDQDKYVLHSPTGCLITTFRTLESDDRMCSAKKVMHAFELTSSNGAYHHMCEPPPRLYDANSLFVSWLAE
jgi:hypothetical protein